MLSNEDNELLCRVGPGTPMGNLMRQYWIPALHRRASCRRPTARRCAYACWARTSSPSAPPPARSASSRTPARTAAPRCSSAATRKKACAASTTAGSSTSTGACVDMPSEPAESNFKNKVRARAYPVRRAQRRRLDVHGPASRAAAAARPRGQHAGRRASTPSRRSCASATGCRPRGRHRHRPPASCTSARQAGGHRSPAASTTTSDRPRAALRGRRHATSARPTAPTARPKTTRTTGASRTSSSRSTR